MMQVSSSPKLLSPNAHPILTSMASFKASPTALVTPLCTFPVLPFLEEGRLQHPPALQRSKSAPNSKGVQKLHLSLKPSLSGSGLLASSSAQELLQKILIPEVLKDTTSNDHSAAKTIQRFFRHWKRVAQEERRRVLEKKLRDLEEQKQRELNEIVEEKERRKLEILQEVATTPSDADDYSPSCCTILEDRRAAIKDIIQNLIFFKKENAFLYKRCAEIRKVNDDLRHERQQRKQLLKRTTRELPQVIQQWRNVLSQYKQQVTDLQTRLNITEKRWQYCKNDNRRVRQCMGKMVQLVEEREPEHADKWDLVDELYQIQRGSQKKRNSKYNTPAPADHHHHHHAHSSSPATGKQHKFLMCHRDLPPLPPAKNHHHHQSPPSCRRREYRTTDRRGFSHKPNKFQ